MGTNQKTGSAIVVVVACALVAYTLPPGVSGKAARDLKVAGPAAVTLASDELEPAPSELSGSGSDLYGSLSGRIVFDGDIPEMPVLVHLDDQKVKPEDRPVLTRIAGCRYIPHAVFAWTDQVVVVRAEDQVPHNVHVHLLRNKRFGDAILPLNENHEWEYVYRQPESVPGAVFCDFHPWMHTG